MELYDMICREYEENLDCENVNIEMDVDGLSVEYDLKEVQEPELALIGQLKAILKDCKITEMPALLSRHQKNFHLYPEVRRVLWKA
jgi:hypothetical protein